MSGFEIVDEYVIEDPETLKILGDPLRIQLLEQIFHLNEAGQLATAKQLADKLDVAQTKLYYHLNLLEEHGLVVIAETALVSGIMEKRYRVRARRLRAEMGSPRHSGDLSVDVIEGMLSPLESILERTRRLAQETVRATLDQADEDAGRVEHEIHIQQTTLHLTVGRAQEIVDRLESLVDEFRADADPDRRPYHLTTVFLPLHSAESEMSEG
ncbi:MAG: helix-turn-helix domain-containing protein [Anaerolineales bacterium]